MWWLEAASNCLPCRERTKWRAQVYINGACSSRPDDPNAPKASARGEDDGPQLDVTKGGVLPRAVEGRSPALRRAHIGECQRAQFFAIKINETQAPPLRHHAGRQRIVAERAAAEMRRQAADIGERVDFDTQQMESCAVGGDHFERDAAKAQKAHRIGRVDEAVDERRLDLVEIGLRRRRLLPGVMRRLPLRQRTVGRVIVSGAAVAVMTVIVIMAVTMIVIVAMVMRVVVLVSPVHGGPQYSTGLLMIERWLPSLPWAASAPSASTTTRTPISAVMSE